MLAKIARSLAIALAIGVAGSSSALAAEVHPIFVRADTQTAGAWNGFQARIQVRPSVYGMAVWPGGYLADGTFIQAGLYQPGSGFTQPGEAKLFFWATENTGGDVNLDNPFGLTWISIPNATLWSWYVVEASKSGSTWTFRYQDPALAWHTVGTFTRNSTLMSFTIDAEYWAEAPVAFETMAIQHAWVKKSTGVWDDVPMTYTSSAPQCGYEEMTSTTPSNALFKSVPAGGATCYRNLW